MSTAAAAPRKPAKKRKRRAHGAEPPSRPWLTRERAALAGVLVLAAALRVYRLMADYPVVGDEGIYLRWAEIIDNQDQWFISLLDGKQPLSYWIYALERMLFPAADPLWMGRMVSVAAGVGVTGLIYAIGRRLDGPAAGLAGALLYALFPWAMMYDRLVYTESLVNLAGAALMLACLWAFEPPRPSPKRELAAGLVFGLAFWLKSTALLFGVVPLVVGLWKRRGQWSALAKGWARMAAALLPFPVLSWLVKPEAPMFETASTVLHQTTFFIAPEELLANPFARFALNAPRFGEYIPYLLGWPGAVSVALAAGYLLYRRSAAGLVTLSIGAIPLLFQFFVLTFMPTRYPFPHLWPWLLVVGLAAADLVQRFGERTERAGARRAAWAALALAVAAPMLHRSWKVLNDPEQNISPHDSGYYFDGNAHSGFGVREAVGFLRAEAARNGPLILLVDPIWSVPADAVFPYLNGKYGIRVHEAWWTQLSGTHAVMPSTEVDLMRSHYERVPAGKLDFRKVDRVFYLTDSNYYPPEAVRVRQPGAQLLLQFAKPGGRSIDVYRLK